MHAKITPTLPHAAPRRAPRLQACSLWLCVEVEGAELAHISQAQHLAQPIAAVWLAALQGEGGLRWGDKCVLQRHWPAAATRKHARFPRASSPDGQILHHGHMLSPPAEGQHRALRSSGTACRSTECISRAGVHRPAAPTL